MNESGIKTQLCLTPNSSFIAILLTSIKLEQCGQDEGFKIGTMF
jgi:hypothetical protein